LLTSIFNLLQGCGEEISIACGQNLTLPAAETMK